MSRLTLQDSRRLKFTIPALLDAVLTFDREHNGWMWRARGQSLVIDVGGGGAVTIFATRNGAAAPEQINRTPAWVAAALLHYCFKRRIPIPRHGTKMLEVLPEGIAMRVEIEVSLPALELTSESWDAVERQRVAGAVVDAASSPDPATEAEAAVPA